MITASLSRRLGCSEGQVYTSTTALAATLLLAFAGVSVPGATDVAGPSFAAPLPPAVIVPTPAPPPTGTPFPGSAAPNLTPPSVTLGSEVLPLQPTPVESGAPRVTPTRPAVFARVGSPGAPGGLAVGSDGRVFVSTNNGTSQGVPGPSVLIELGPSGQQLGQVRLSGQPADHANGLGAASVDPADGAVIVVEVDTAKLLRVNPATGAQRVGTTIPDVQPCPLALNQTPCEPGVTDHRPLLSAVAFGAGGSAYIADAGQATIWRWQPGKAPVQWYSSTDLATGDGPAGLAFDGAGKLLFTAGTTLDVSSPNAGALYSLGVSADGSVGTRTLVTSFASGQEPGAIAIDPLGAVYAILRGTGTIEVIRKGTRTTLSTAGGPIPLDGPSALAIHDGQLLVANQSASNTASNWAVLRFPLQP